MYRTENEPVSLAGAVRRREKRGGKMKVCFAMLLKTNVVKMSDLPLSTMLI
jgi:hypothetical protein